jgi:glycosyltransferase involved in cell wall biosynthesis
VDQGPDGDASTDRRRLRILLVIKGLGFGGAERLLMETVAAGDRGAFDYEVAYVLAGSDGLADAIRSGGTPVHPLGASRSADLTWLGRLRSLVVAGRFDVVHFHLPYTAGLGRLAVATVPRAERPAVVYTEHSLWNLAAVITKAINRAGIGRDQSLIVVSQAAHDALPPALQGRARVIVHGVSRSQADELTADRDRIRTEVRAELGVPDGELLVLTVANIRPEKGYDVLLETTRILAEREVPVRVAAVGGGPMEDEIRERHRALGLGDRLQLLGQRHDVLRLMAAADIYVLASHQEGMPVTLMEATSMGLPIVATSVGGVPQVVTDGIEGLIVPPGDPEQLADALQRVAADPVLRDRLGRAAREKSAMFDVTGSSREIEGIYREITDNRPGRRTSIA